MASQRKARPDQQQPHEIVDKNGKRLGYYANKSAAMRAFNRNSTHRDDGASVRPVATQVAKPAPFNAVDFVMRFENGELEHEEVIDGFQHLVDSGLAWQLQGSYGRTAAHLIKQGLVTQKGN